MILECIAVCREQAKLSEEALALAQGSKASVAPWLLLDCLLRWTSTVDLAHDENLKSLARKNIDACFLTIHY